MVQPPAPQPAIRVRQRPASLLPKTKTWPNGAATYEHGTGKLLGYSCRNRDGSYTVWNQDGVLMGSVPSWDFSAQIALMRKRPVS